MIDGNFEMAYWLVIKSLDLPDETPMDYLLKAHDKLQTCLGSPYKMKKILMDCLSVFEWNWPEWELYAWQDHDTLSSMEAIADRDVLASMTLPELKRLIATDAGRGKTRKDDYIRYLSHNPLNEIQRAAIETKRQALHADRVKRCRLQMITDMVVHMLSISHAMMRRQQLSDPDLLQTCPYWEFVSSRHMPEPCHTQWDGLVLRWDDPWWDLHFPPMALGCHCRVTAVRPDKYIGQVAPNDQD